MLFDHLSTHDFVYFGRRERDGAIKIGVTGKWPGYRCRDLRYDQRCEVTLLAHILGGRRCERRLHFRFFEDAIKGENEWFRPSPTLLGFIKRLPPPTRSWPEWAEGDAVLLTLEQIDSRPDLATELDAYLAAEGF